MSRVNDVNIKLWKEQTANGRAVVEKIKRDEPRHDSDKKQIAELVRKLPKLDKLFEVHRKIGEGTFSSVYVASLRRQATLPEHERRLFAVKHLVPTAHPARVEHELRCLQDIGGCDNVIGVELCLRHYDTIVFVMPYIPHRKFSEYMGDMNAGGLRSYVRALLEALRRVHSFGIIHRDVKPSNFLYDMHMQRYMLVDFGLAQRMTPASTAVVSKGNNRVTVEPLRPSNKRPRDEPQEEELPPNKKMAHASAVDGHSKSSSIQGATCVCTGRGAVCGDCVSRPAARAPRAGTQGFRPPEVLLKYPHQTTAVDMWASGVMVVSVLSGRYPFFRAGDDTSAAAELVSLLGSEAMQRAAHSLGRRLVTSSVRRGLCLRKLCARLRSPATTEPGSTGPFCRHCTLPQSECVCRDNNCRPWDQIERGRSWAGFPDAAFALAARLLDPDPHTRITAADALTHPFLVEAEL